MRCFYGSRINDLHDDSIDFMSKKKFAEEPGAMKQWK